MTRARWNGEGKFAQFGNNKVKMDMAFRADMADAFDLVRADYETRYNNEPFWSAMHGQDLKDVMARSGFAKDSQFVVGVRAVVDRSIFPAAETEEQEDYGRAAVWNAYGAWKAAAQEMAA
jgi:hypothetical protein